MEQKSVYFAELEVKARKLALRRIADLFQRPEQLEKIDLVRDQFNDQKVATEAQLRMAMCNQLDGTQMGMNKLDEANVEIQETKKRLHEISAILNGLRGVSEELSETKNLAKKYAQLGAAMENMSYLVRAPELFNNAYQLIEKDNFLDGHKIIQDLEGIRDVLMTEVHRDKTTGDTETLVEYFKDAEELNGIFVKKIRMLGYRLMSAVISEPSMVIDCVRVVDREERADLIWEKRAEKNGFMPPGRPKRWKKILFDATAKTIHDKVFGSGLDSDDDKNKIVRDNEAIRQHARNDLKIAKNICPIYFPPDYNIFDRIVEMYHNAIGEYVNSLVSTSLTEKAIAQLLIWINSYRTEDFMGDPFLNIDFSRLTLNYPVTLLSSDQVQSFSDRYVNQKMREFSSWARNSLSRQSQDWRKHTLPEVDGSSYYYTGLPQLVMTPLSEMTGKGNLLRALGASVREQFLVKFVDHMDYFVNDFSGALRLYRQEYLEDRSRFQYYIEYMLANANDAHVFSETIAEVLMRELSDIPQLKGQLTAKINGIKQGFIKLSENCRKASEEVVLMDLSTVLNNVLTSKWLEPEDITANYLQGTLADYDETLKHARPKIYTEMVNNIGEKLLLEYLKVVITRRCPLKSAEMRRRAGEKMLKDSHMMQTYLQDGMKVRKELVAAYGALSDIARFFSEDDTSMIYLDIANLVKRFPDVQENQLAAILLARGDISKSEAKELVANGVHPGEQRTGVTSLNIFTKLATAMQGT
ncbi:Exocyst complex component 3 [Fasciolopsis buskii]|uniref:Exocyst complex component 3 n=1 Tax=Fasciolopsis buskii TaxID=27845 RepID=A0A8E0VFZ4_9TREM|nr:Exocyst complex component 3 [Fasciolopsis buski]